MIIYYLMQPVVQERYPLSSLSILANNPEIGRVTYDFIFETLSLSEPEDLRVYITLGQ